MSCGYEHTVLLDNNGQVWTFGDSTLGRLGYESSLRVTEPRKLEDAFDGNEIISVSAGGEFTVCLDDKGSVWTFGVPYNFEIGRTGDNVIPGKLSLNVVIVAVTCGACHTLLLDENSSVWSFGWNDYGQLGWDSRRSADYEIIEKVPLENPIQLMTAGDRFSLLVDNTGTLLFAGESFDGKENTSIFVPVENYPENIVAISSGWSHAVLMNGRGDLFSFGKNCEFQLGLENPQEVRNFPTLIEGIPEMKFISCGGEQTRCIDIDGYLWRCGGNTEGGPKEVTIVKTLTKYDDFQVKSILSGSCANHVVVLDVKDQVWDSLGTIEPPPKENTTVHNFHLWPSELFNLFRKPPNLVKSARK